MLNGRHLRVWEAQTVDDFRKEVIGFGRALGFDTMSAMTVIDHSRTHTEFFNVENVPAGYQETFRNIDVGRRDPVMQHCKHASIPIIWDWETYHHADAMDLWEEQAAFGLKTGVGLALHLPGDRHFFIGLDRDKPLDLSSKRLTAVVAEMQLFAVHAQEAAVRIFAPLSTSKQISKLSPREIQALLWTMDGKTASEVADALNISTRTAVFHLRNATIKLGCKNKYQAVLEALRNGLFQM
jgi:DNA-binding CsgD family transcriptional regulator